LIIGKGGKDQGTTAGWKGMIDDVRIYDFVLNSQEIKQAMRGESDLAWDPSPATGSTPDLNGALPLRWQPGENAKQHDVYFGTDRDAVASVNRFDKTGVARGRQSDTSYTPPEGVQWAGGPYFWRVDEYNADGTLTQGRIWQFTVADFLLIDDFESYNDINPEDEGSNRIYTKWIDGWDDPANGSTVGYGDPGLDMKADTAHAAASFKLPYGLPCFSADGSRVAYIARKGAKYVAVIDGTEGPEYDRIGYAEGEGPGALTDSNLPQPARDLGSGLCLPHEWLGFTSDGAHVL
jgi:hypothetical protein